MAATLHNLPGCCVFQSLEVFQSLKPYTLVCRITKKHLQPSDRASDQAIEGLLVLLLYSLHYASRIHEFKGRKLIL